MAQTPPDGSQSRLSRLGSPADSLHRVRRAILRNIAEKPRTGESKPAAPCVEARNPRKQRLSRIFSFLSANFDHSTFRRDRRLVLKVLDNGTLEFVNIRRRISNFCGPHILTLPNHFFTKVLVYGSHLDGSTRSESGMTSPTQEEEVSK
jgi:hypothetical protein